MTYMEGTASEYSVDKSVVALTKNVETIKDGIECAYERAKKWRKDVKPYSVRVFFSNKEQIENRKVI